ncbi:MAG: proline--tRNA ligase [Kiritimatiellae bacterium]|nr:proline--tRNA ligase [Kiritimatiellia bacterium]
MRWSKTLLCTLREDPKDAEIVSHKLMMRAGLLVKLEGGLYSYSPLGVRVLHKVEKIVREEMDRAGASEVLFTALQPISLWEESGRAGLMGKSMFRLKDRNENTMVLGPTHEEVATDYLRTLASSYRQLPATIYQIQTKFRDEIRPRFGLMRCKEFVMKDAYSFDIDSDGADESYRKMYDAYLRIFARCGLDAHPVEADTGAIGGNHSHEFMVLAPSGEDGILHCPSCHYAANQERAERKAPPCDWSSPSAAPRAKVATPGAHTVDEAAAALGIASDQVVKSLVYVADGKPVMVLMRGNADLCEPKLRRVLGAAELEMADPETTAKVAGPFGSIGPIGASIPVFADNALREARDMAVGAGEDGYHVAHCNLMDDPDVKIEAWHDLASVVAGDLCPRCGAPLALERGIEVGHVFKLGTKYTKAMGFTVLASNSQPVTPIMGCYGIGVSRTVQAIAEQNNDADGIVWPASVSPYQVALLSLDSKSESCAGAVAQLEEALENAGIDVLVDDRDERPGIKFKDADLIGCTVRVTVGAKSLAKGGAEVRLRKTGETELVPVSQVCEKVKALLAAN